MISLKRQCNQEEVSEMLVESNYNRLNTTVTLPRSRLRKSRNGRLSSLYFSFLYTQAESELQVATCRVCCITHRTLQLHKFVAVMRIPAVLDNLFGLNQLKIK